MTTEELIEQVGRLIAIVNSYLTSGVECYCEDWPEEDIKEEGKCFYCQLGEAADKPAAYIQEIRSQ